MPKRKLGDMSDCDNVSSASVERRKVPRRAGLDGIIENGEKALFRAIKVSRGFERQKLGRRQKTAKEQDASTEIARLAREVAALKTLDLLAASETHLYKSLLRSKPISTSSAFPTYIAAKVAHSLEHPDPATANVTARLFNSNPVKAALRDILANVHRELGIRLEEVPAKKKRLRATDYGNKTAPGKANDKPVLAAPKDSVVRGTDHHLDNGRRSLSTDDRDAANSDGESVDYDRYESRLADSENENEAGSLEDKLMGGGVDGNDSQGFSGEEPPRRDNQLASSKHQASLSISPPISPSLTPSPPPSAALPNALPSQARHATKAPTKQTTFLPSLIGGYWSGSESAPEDDNSSAIKTPKNRRGQQERRAIWEKKYGRGAKHLQGQPQARQQNRDDGWDARRGASDGREKRGRGRDGMRGERGAMSSGLSREFASGANEEMVSGKRTSGRGGKVEGKRKRDDGPLHPSWEAKKKAKEKAGSGVVAFQGKKVVFD